MNLLTEPDK